MPRLHLGNERRAGRSRMSAGDSTSAAALASSSIDNATSDSRLDGFDFGNGLDFNLDDEFDSRVADDSIIGTGIVSGNGGIGCSSGEMADGVDGRADFVTNSGAGGGHYHRSETDQDFIGGNSASAKSFDKAKKQKCSNSAKKKKKHQQQKVARGSSSNGKLYDSSSDEDNDLELGMVAKKSAKDKKSANAGSGRNGGVGNGSRRVKPTHSSPKITHKDLANNGSKKTKKSSTAAGGGKKETIGKPINKKKKAEISMGNNGDDENTENYKQKSAGNKRKKPSSSSHQNQQLQTKGKKKAATTNAKGGGTKKGEMAMMTLELSSEDDSSSSSSSEDEIISRTKSNAKSMSKSNAGAIKKRGMKSSEFLLEDTDDDDDDDDSSDEEEVVEKIIGKNKKEKQSSQKTKQKGAGQSSGKASSRASNARTSNSNSNTSNSKISKKQQQQQVHSPKQQIQVLPLRGLAIDNRTLPNVTSETMAIQSFLGQVPRLIKDSLDKGVLSAYSQCEEAGDGGGTIVAALVHGAKCSEAEDTSKTKKGGKGRGKGRAGALVETAIVPRASYLFEPNEQSNVHDGSNTLGTKDQQALWLTNFVSPINKGFARTDNDDVLEDEMNGGFEGNSMFDYGAEYPMEGRTNDLGGSSKYRVHNGFKAAASWSYFGDLVESINGKLSSSTNSNQPRPITLFTTDANLFADVQSSAHIHGLEQLWKRLHFSKLIQQSKNVSDITIMIVETTSAMQMMQTIRSSYSDSYNDDGVGSNDHSLLNSSSGASFIPNRLHVIQCVNDIRRRIRELNEDQNAKHRINLQLEFMEGNHVSFQSLLQSWAKESFSQTYGSGGGARGQLTFDLPETLDGTMCSMSLDLEYTVLPNGLDSPETLTLVDEIRQISSLSPSSVEVIQTIPLSSVDSSLIYGVPMAARAGMESHDYTEMKMLSRQLWKYLCENDMALVLRVRTGSEESSLNDVLDSKVSACRKSGGEQLFLLVCEESVEKPFPLVVDQDSDYADASEALNVVRRKERKGESPCHGMLFRYATRNQILRFGNEESHEEVEDADAGNSAEMSQQYYDYIERSLDTLVKTGLNPLLTGDRSNIN